MTNHSKLRFLSLASRREKLVVDEYPDVTFTETRDPVVDKDGKLITKVLASWSANNPEVNNHVGVIVPSQNRPVVKTVAENRANTIVLRLTADVRFSCKAGWNKFQRSTWHRGQAMVCYCCTFHQRFTCGFLVVGTLARCFRKSNSCQRTFAGTKMWGLLAGCSPPVDVALMGTVFTLTPLIGTTKLAANHGVARGWRQF